MDLKSKVLDEIISLMDEKEGEGLKKKSPKFMAMSVEVKKPSEKELPKVEIENEGEEMEEELDPEMIKKLLEQLKG